MATIRIKRSTGSTAPTGLTFGEPAFVDGTNSLYVTKNDTTSLRVGAEVDSNTSLGTSDNKIPTQNAVKTYVDNNVAAGAVASLNGVTGAVFIGAGTGIGIAVAGKGITLTNTGVQSIAGTSNQITVSGATGAVTLSLPSTVTVPGALNVTTNLTVTGNLTVNGTTTTVNSDTMTIDDPIILLGTSGGVPISVSDGGKDRGIGFNYYDTAGRTGFFGWDASESQFVLAQTASIDSDVVTVSSHGNLKVNYLKLHGANGDTTVSQIAGGTNARTIYFPDVSGTLITTGDTGTVTSTMILDGTIVNGDINASAGIVDTKLATISTANKVSLTALDIDGGTDIGAALVSTDLIIVDDGANGTNRKAAVSRITDYTFGLVSGDITITSGGVAAIGTGVIVDADINASAAISDTKLGTISTANKVSLAALDIDGGTATTTIAGTDLLIVDNGANGTNRKVTVNNLFGTNSTATIDGGSF